MCGLLTVAIIFKTCLVRSREILIRRLLNKNLKFYKRNSQCWMQLRPGCFLPLFPNFRHFRDIQRIFVMLRLVCSHAHGLCTGKTNTINSAALVLWLTVLHLVDQVPPSPLFSLTFKYCTKDRNWLSIVWSNTRTEHKYKHRDAEITSHRSVSRSVSRSQILHKTINQWVYTRTV